MHNSGEVNQLPSKPRIAVLLAAYNGMRWIEEQLRSILKQKGVEVTIFISVDQSTDDTYTWCRTTSEREPNVILLPPAGRFGSAAKNFYRLIRDVDFSNFDYVALADQDDIWIDDKLLVACELMTNNGYTGTSGNVTAFWHDGRKLLIDKAQPQRKYDFLFESAGPGCSYVLRTTETIRFKHFLIENWASAYDVVGHDWLIYAWFRSNNLRWFIDGTPKILYRQHSHNQAGANEGFTAYRNRLKLLRSGWYRTEIKKVSKLVAENLPSLPTSIINSGLVPRLFLLKHSTQIRRRARDRLFFFLIVMFRVY